jgi:hypothetical protein
MRKHPGNLCGNASLFSHPKRLCIGGNAMMKTLVSMVTLGLIVSFSAPAFAGTKVPTTQSECTKAGMHWDTSAKKCSKGM